MIDLQIAARFLSLLEDGGIFTFQTFAEADTHRDADVGVQPASAYPEVLHGPLDQHADRLTALNDAGAGIFVMVNAGDGVRKEGARTCRTSENVQRIRAVFADLDGSPLRPLLESAMPPDWVVQSSPARWHGYWKVRDCPLDRFRSVQAALATRFNGDPKVIDLPRVMRVPGFVHRKADPFQSQLWEPSTYQRVLEMDHE